MKILIWAILNSRFRRRFSAMEVKPVMGAFLLRSSRWIATKIICGISKFKFPLSKQCTKAKVVNYGAFCWWNLKAIRAFETNLRLCSFGSIWLQFCEKPDTISTWYRVRKVLTYILLQNHTTEIAFLKKNLRIFWNDVEISTYTVTKAAFV